MTRELHLVAGDMILDNEGLWQARRYGTLVELRDELIPVTRPGLDVDMPPFHCLWDPIGIRIHDVRGNRNE